MIHSRLEKREAGMRERVWEIAKHNSIWKFEEQSPLVCLTDSWPPFTQTPALSFIRDTCCLVWQPKPDNQVDIVHFGHTAVRGFVSKLCNPKHNYLIRRVLRLITNPRTLSLTMWDITLCFGGIACDDCLNFSVLTNGYGSILGHSLPMSQCHWQSHLMMVKW